MNLLEKITTAKRRELEVQKSVIPVHLLEKSKYFKASTCSLEKSLLKLEGYGIIAEFKRQSPSRGIINPSARSEDVCPGYINSGAAAVSILTNNSFGGSNEDLGKVRDLIRNPILRKEFIIDEYQVIESKSMGADVILLIADILSGRELRELSSVALSLGMEVLFEIHDDSGIDKLPPGARLVGVNSRNLGNFSINMEILNDTVNKLPAGAVKIAESGIDSAETMYSLNSAGFSGFLIGELFMREADPAKACEDFIANLNQLRRCK
jgi:indole-3-glycerol phosphate synthase